MHECKACLRALRYRSGSSDMCPVCCLRPSITPLSIPHHPSYRDPSSASPGVGADLEGQQQGHQRESQPAHQHVAQEGALVCQAVPLLLQLSARGLQLLDRVAERGHLSRQLLGGGGLRGGGGGG